MANRCDRCGKGNLRGKKIGRARQGLNYRSPKIFRANLHSVKVLVGGRKKKLMLCTKCLRRAKKEQVELGERMAVLKAKTASKSKKKKIVKSKKVIKKKRLSRKEARTKRKAAKIEKEQKRGRKTTS